MSGFPISPAVVERLGWVLVHSLWQFALIAFLAGATVRLLHRNSATMRYGLLSVAMVAIAVVPLATWTLQPDTAAENLAIHAGVILVHESNVATMPAADPSPLGSQPIWPIESSDNRPATDLAEFASSAETSWNTSADPSWETSARTMDETSAGDSPASSATASVEPSWFEQATMILRPWLAWIVAGWSVGVLLFSVRPLLGWHTLRRLRRVGVSAVSDDVLATLRRVSARLGLRRAVRVLHSTRARVPVVVGYLRPIILLPASLVTSVPTAQLEAILAHELAHVRRHDFLVNLLQTLVETVFFYHPAVWWLSTQLRAERENCCDDLVVAALGDRVEYGRALLAIEELRGRGTVLAVGAADGSLLARVRRIAGLPSDTPSSSPWPAVSLTFCGFVVCALGLLRWHSFAEADPQETKAGVPEELPRTLLEPAFLLPGHYNMMDVRFVNNDTELIAVSTYQLATIRRCDVVGRTLKSEINLSSDKHLRPFREGSFKLSGDGRRVVAATDEFVGIWETSTGELLKKLPFPTKESIYDCWIDKLDCTPDLSVIAGNWAMPGRLTLVYDAHVMIWDGVSGKLLQTVIDKQAAVLQSIDLSSDGKLLATTNGAGAKVWDASTGKLLRSFTNDNKGRKHADPEVSNQYTSNVWSVQLSPDGKQLAVSDILGVRLWDVRSGELRHQLDASYQFSSGNATLVYSRDGQLLARTGTSSKEKGSVVPIWSTQSGEKLFELRAGAHCGAFSDDNKQFAVGLSENRMALAVFQLSGVAADAPAQPSSDGNVRGGLRFHHRGKKAEEFIDLWKPVWGDEQLGIRYGIAMAVEQRQFRIGQRVPMMVFFRNVSDKPLQVDVRPDLTWDTPNVTGSNGAAVELERVALLGNVPHYREKLQPGEAFGAIYLSIGLGENPRPGRQDWAPYWKTPRAGSYKLAQTLALKVAGPEAGRDEKSGEWKDGTLTSGTLEFEIVDEPALGASGSNLPRKHADRLATDEESERESRNESEPQKQIVSGETNESDRDNARIDPNGEIVGRLVNAATGKSVEGATIACGAVINNSDKRGGANTITDAEGRYRLPVPSPGIYNVWLKKYDRDTSMTAAADDGILVEAGKVATSQLHLVVGRKVTGKVVDADGKLYANVGLSCYSAARPHSGGVQSVRTKEDGTFEFSLPPGRAYVYVNPAVKDVGDDSGRTAHAYVIVPKTGDPPPITLTLEKRNFKFGDAEWLRRSTPGTRIVRHEGDKDVTGTVVDEAGEPVAGAKVFRYDGPIVATNDHGEFRVEVRRRTQFVMHAFSAGYHLWTGTPTSGDVLEIVLEKKRTGVIGAGAAADDAKAPAPLDEESRSGLVPGRFGGVLQLMRIGAGESISYGDGKGLCQMTLFDDERLRVAFHNDREIWTDVTLPLATAAGGKRRAVWSAEMDGHQYQATAIPFAKRGCLFRLEKRLDGALVHGSQQFFAVRSRHSGAKQDETVAPIDHREWRVDQSGTGVVAGRYTGASQAVRIAADGTLSYSDQPHGICHLAVLEDSRLTATFRDARGMPTEFTLPLVTTAAQHRASWSAEIDGQTLRATAIPYSDTVYIFRLEKLHNGKLIEGEQQFYAIDQKLRPATPEEKKAQAAKRSNTAFLEQQLEQFELPSIIARLKKQEEILKGCIVTAETKMKQRTGFSFDGPELEREFKTEFRFDDRGRIYSKQHGGVPGRVGTAEVLQQLQVGAYDGRSVTILRGRDAYDWAYRGPDKTRIPREVDPRDYLYRYWNEPLSELLAKKKYRITGKQRWRDQDVIAIESDATVNEEQKTSYQGRLLVAPTLDYAVVVRSARIRFDDISPEWHEFSRQETFHYEQNEKTGLWFPRDGTYTSLNPTREQVRKMEQAPLVWRKETKFTRWQPNPAFKDADFTLEIPEGIFVMSEPIPPQSKEPPKRKRDSDQNDPQREGDVDPRSDALQGRKTDAQPVPADDSSAVFPKSADEFYARPVSLRVREMPLKLALAELARQADVELQLDATTFPFWYQPSIATTICRGS